MSANSKNECEFYSKSATFLHDKVFILNEGKLADVDAIQPSYKVALKRAAVDVKRLPDGELILRSPYPLPSTEENIGDWLRHWAAEDPRRVFLSKRHHDEHGEAVWEEISYGDALNQVRAIAQALAVRDLSESQPVLVISKNGIQNALLQLAAMDIGVPAVHINPLLALNSEQFEGFKFVFEHTTPGLVFAAEGLPFEKALRYAADQGAEILLDKDPVPGLSSTDFQKITRSWRKGAAKKARAKITPETIAKIQFNGTSPREMQGIVTTQVTMSSNQEALAQIIPALKTRPPIVVDDAPWHQVSGGSLIFNAVLKNGGTLYIDRFLSAEVEGSNEDNIETPSPSIYFSEIAPLEELITKLDSNILLRKAFFRNLDLVWVVDGALSTDMRAKFQAIATEQTGNHVAILASFCGLGTASINTALYFDTDTEANIGLPIPGTFVKLVKIGAEEDDTWGIKIKNDNLHPAIWRNGTLVKAETDEEGFYAVYETVRLIDDTRPFKGIQRLSQPIS